MFLKKSSADDFYSDLEKKIEEVSDQTVSEKQAFERQAMEYILEAASLLDEAGFDVKANNLTTLLEKLAWHVPTDDEMVENLKENGTVFDSEDFPLDDGGEIISVEDPMTDDWKHEGEVELVESN